MTTWPIRSAFGPLYANANQLTHAIYWAALSADEPLLHELIDWGHVDENGRSIAEKSLRVACLSGEPDACERLIEAGVNPDAHFHSTLFSDPKDAITPMHYAVQRGVIPLIRALRAAGASLDLMDIDVSPLMLAAQQRHVTAVIELLEMGALAGRKTASGASALSMAIVGCSGQTAAERELLEEAAFTPDTTEWSHIAVALLAYGASADDFKGRKGCLLPAMVPLFHHPLHSAARWGYPTLCAKFLDQGINPLSINDRGDNAIQVALTAGQYDIESLLRAHVARGAAKTAAEHLALDAG